MFKIDVRIWDFKKHILVLSCFELQGTLTSKSLSCKHNYISLIGRQTEGYWQVLSNKKELSCSSSIFVCLVGKRGLGHLRELRSTFVWYQIDLSFLLPWYICWIHTTYRNMVFVDSYSIWKSGNCGSYFWQKNEFFKTKPERLENCLLGESSKPAETDVLPTENSNKNN